MLEEKPIVVNLAEGQNTLTILTGDAPEQLDVLAPVKVDLMGTIEAPLNWLEKRVGDIDQHKAHVVVNRDKLQIMLVINEDDPYTNGKIVGELKYSEIFLRLGINSDKQWQPEVLSRFLKLNRSLFLDKTENMKVVTALKQIETKVEQAVSRERQENGNVGLSFKQQVANSNIPERFTLKIPVFSGGSYTEVAVETFVTIDGAQISIALQSAAANDVIEYSKDITIGDVVAKIREIAPEIAIIEQ